MSKTTGIVVIALIASGNAGMWLESWNAAAFVFATLICLDLIVRRDE